jgi:hypothetical protein
VSDHGAIDEQVRELVKAPRPELEQLVDQALERELNQLVEQRLNGHYVEHAAKSALPAPAAKVTTKVCEGCGETTPEMAFEKYRKRCRECRRRDRRTTTGVAAAAGPDRPEITASELAAHARRFG